MIYGLWLSAAGLQANQYQMEVAANNLANVETPGFKHDLAVIRERMIERYARAGSNRSAHSINDGMTGGSFVSPTYHSFAPGAIVKTGGSLDVAIRGDGFFTVQDGTDQRYSRDGRFTRAADGSLVMVAGGGHVRVLDVDGNTIRLRGGKVAIGEDGTVRENGNPIGRIGIVTFTDKQMLRKVGGNLFQATGGARPEPASGSVVPGAIERSTVSPIAGIATMIKVSRAYQMNANMIRLQDETIGQAVNRIGRIG